MRYFLMGCVNTLAGLKIAELWGVKPSTFWFYASALIIGIIFDIVFIYLEQRD